MIRIFEKQMHVVPSRST